MMSLRHAIIMAGGVGSRLCVLSDKRAKPAVPFAGKYRIIDFTLSNCVNSGITDVSILTQYMPQSLNEHLGIGKPWDLDRRHGGLRIFQPHPSWHESDWYAGTANAVYQNLPEIGRRTTDDVLVLSGDHVYKMDYTEMAEFHRQHKADVTIAVLPVPWEETGSFGIIELEPDGRARHFVEKPKHRPATNTASMGVYIFRYEVLAAELERDAADPTSQHDFGKNILPQMLAHYRVFGFPFQGYWQDVGTLDNYYAVNLELAGERSPLDFYDPRWLVHTRDVYYPPVKLVEEGKADASLLSNGCIVYGDVRDSVLSPGVVVEKGAVVERSIILNDTWIGPNVHVDRAILDKNVHVGRGARIGDGSDLTPNRACPEHLSSGLTVIGKQARIPEGCVIGRNVRIGSEVSEGLFQGCDVPSGAVIQAPGVEGH
jgi:glucose-1-phosphate adenylyltransferase